MPTHRWGDYTPSGHLGRILDDKTPQLGGMLDGNGFTFNGAVAFEAQAGEALSKGNAVYVSGVSGNKPVVMKADADDAAKMPAFGIAETDANLNANVNVVTFGTVYEIDTSAYSAGDELYVSTTAGALTATKPTGATAKLQNIGKVIRSHASAGSIKVGGAGRTNAVPNLDNGTVFIGDSNNQAEQRALVEADISDFGTYLTAESDTLDSVTDRGATTTNAITVGNLTSTGIDDNASSTAVTINSSGNVGIGATSPAGPLHIQSATNRTLILDGTYPTGSFTWQSIRRSGTEKWRWFLENDDDVTLYADVNSTGSVMRWGSDGNVGIGTTSPSGKLDVTGSVGTVRVETTGNKISLTRNGANYISAAGGVSASISYEAPVHYFNSGDGLTTRLIINDSGNVGIGTTSPDEKLEIYQGNIKLGTDTNTTSKLIFERSAVDRAEIYVGSSNQLQFDLGGTERMRISSGGTVTISNGSGSGSNGNLTLTASSSGNEGGQINFNTVSSGTYSIDTHTDNMRFLNGTTSGDYYWFKNSNSAIGMTLTGAGDLDVDGVITADEFNTPVHQATNLAVGWYTIGYLASGRAGARFAVWDTGSGRHQYCVLYASHMYGTNASNTINILTYAVYSGSPIQKFRLKESGTYDGAALQVYIDDATNNVSASIVGDNVQSPGWTLADWVADATNPGVSGTWSSFVGQAEIDLADVGQGGISATGNVLSGGNIELTTQYADLLFNGESGQGRITTGSGAAGGFTVDNVYSGAGVNFKNNGAVELYSSADSAIQGSLTIDTSGNIDMGGSLTVGDGSSTASHIAIKAADDTTADELQFYNGTTRIGEIGTQDTTWLRINQETAKNIYTPRYIRADGGFFVDGTAKGINGSGNFIGGTVTTPTLNITDGNTQMTRGANNAFRLATNYGYVDVGPMNTTYSHFSTDRSLHYFNTTTVFDGGGIRAYDTSADARFPIYYDSQDTSYYCNPAGTSRFHTNYSNNHSTVAGNGYGLRFWNSDSYKIYMSQTGNATWGGQANGQSTSDYNMYFRMTSGTNRGFVFNNPTTGKTAAIDGNARGYFERVHIHDGQNANGGLTVGSTYLDVKYNATGAGGIRLFDSQNVLQGYWYANGAGEHGLLDNDGAWAVRCRTGTNALELRTNNNNEFLVYTSYVRGVGSVRSPIFYDFNNTTYYAHLDNTADSIRAAGDIVAYYSDERLKDIEGNIPNALDKVSTLNGFYYRGNEKAQKLGYDDKLKVGLSAQEVQKVLPEVIKSCPADNRYMTLDYSKVVPLLVEAIKELKSEIEELKK